MDFITNYLSSNLIISYLSSNFILWNSLLNLIISILILFWTIFCRYFLKIIVFSYLEKYAEKTKTKIDDIILLSVERFVNIWFWFLAFYLAKLFIILPKLFDIIVNKWLIIILIFIFFYLLKNLAWDLIDNYFLRKSKVKWKYFSSLVKNLSNIVIWGIWITMILSKLWYDITTLVAGLWISWIAVALAIQPILASIFASFFIFIDKPFKVWDLVSTWDYTWTVKEIWLYSTRIITFHWTEVVVSNTEIMNSNIENISQRKVVRIDISLWIIYEISTEKLKKSMDLIRKILEKNERITDDIRIYFKEFWDFSLNLEITYFIDEPIYNERLAIQSEVNLEIKDKMEQNKIDFAYPTAVHYIKK